MHLSNLVHTLGLVMVNCLLGDMKFRWMLGYLVGLVSGIVL